MNKIFGAFTDSANLFWGALVTVWAHFIGANWPVFALFLVLNVIDCHYVRGLAVVRTIVDAAGNKIVPDPDKGEGGQHE